MMAFMDISKLLGLPVLASEHGKDVDNFIIYIHWLMIVLFVGWMGYFVYTLVRFRESRNPKADPVGVKGHASNYLEIAVAIIEGVLLIGFAIPLWAKVVEDFPDPAKSTVVRITAEQFTWNARYPGADGAFGAQDPNVVNAQTNKFGYVVGDPKGKDDVSAPLKTIHFPVNKPVLIYLSSMDVIHSLAIRPLRVCQDAMPGLIIPVHFVPNREGQYRLTCAQLCGNGHASMDGYVTVESEENFQKWLKEQASSGAATGGFE